HLRLARADRLAVDVDGARAAEAGAAAEARAGQPQIVADVPEQRHVRIAVVSVGFAVHCEFDHVLPFVGRRPSPVTGVGGVAAHYHTDGYGGMARRSYADASDVWPRDRSSLASCRSPAG